jgi:uncharacterized protein YifN (PemK superfamily)
MALPFAANPGDVLFCHYPEPYAENFHPPEMTKVRRVVVLSPRNRLQRVNTLVVVPISLTVPPIKQAFHYELEDRYPFLHATMPLWIKGDMIGHVSTDRLRAFRDGSGRAVRRVLSPRDLGGARGAAAAAAGIRLTL